MTWFKIDDSFYDHPKVFDAPDCAVALWTRAGTWSARNLTEGFVPSGMPARLCDDPDTAVKELVRRGLWLRTAGGYRFHDWTEYQPSRDAVEDLRAKRAAAGRLGGQARAAKANGKHLLSKSQASATPVAKQNPTPTRPEGSVVQVVPRGKAVTREHASPPESQPEPPRRCPRHVDDAEPPNCGACADARRTHERWEWAEAERKRTWQKCRTHPGQPAHNCGLCRADRLAADQESR